MSIMTIRPCLPFCRVRFVGQSVAPEENMAWIGIVPDGRYTPRCHACGTAARGVHSSDHRALRDLNLGGIRVWINCTYRKIYCPQCEGVRVEAMTFVDPYRRVTKRLARAIHELCKVLATQQVAEHFGLDWKTVKQIDQAFLEEQFGETGYRNLRILAVDEVAIHKGHRYMTGVLDYETGRVVWLGKDRKAETLMAFFDGMTPEQRQSVQAIAMDMWKPYIKAVAEKAPHVKIVFDLFHAVHAFNKVSDKVRLAEYRKAARSDK